MLKQQKLRLQLGSSIDKRSLAAYNIYEKFKKGNILVHKTTRAGATSSLVAESLNRFEKVLVLEPTNKIAAETIVSDVKNICEVENVSIVQVVANHYCIHNQKQIKKYPDLKHLPFLPLAESCEKCKYYNKCSVTEVLRKPNSDGIVLTYHKLKALLVASMTRPNSTAEKILEGLRKAENIILDEVHELQYGKKESVEVYDSDIGETWNLDRYECLPEKPYKWIREVIKRMKVLKEDQDLKIMIHEVKGGAEDSKFYQKHLRKRKLNPCFELGNNRRQNEAIAVGTLKEIIELTKVRKDYNLGMDDVLRIYEMMALVIGNIITVSAIKNEGNVKVNLSFVDDTFLSMIKSFVRSMTSSSKRIIMTSATICSFDYSEKLLGGLKIENILFGKNGDPLNTNEKMLILADNKKYNAIGDRSRYKKRDEIVSRIREIMDYCEGKEVLIVNMSKKETAKLYEGFKAAKISNDNNHYYKSPEMMGVKASARIIIAVGLANKPSNAFDAITINKQESKKLLHEAVQSDTWQAISRVKDPEGIENSVVFGLGCCVDDLKACITWGFNRQITGITENKRGCRNKVDVEILGGEITKPKLIHCKNFEEMLTFAGRHLNIESNSLKNRVVFEENRLDNYFLDGSCKKQSVFLDSPIDLLKLIAFRRDAYGKQQIDGSYFAETKLPLTDRDLEFHIRGERTIGAYQLGKDSLIRWFAFDVDSHAPKVKDPVSKKKVPKVETQEEIDKRNMLAEENKDRLFRALTALNIPFILEASGSAHSYHFWILLSVPVPASLAVFVGEEIKKIAGIIGDIELYPKQKTLTRDKKYGNLLKLPFATHRKNGKKSKILINGEFQATFSGLEIETIDISALEALQQEQKSEVREKVKKAKKTFKKNYPKLAAGVEGFIRPCISYARYKKMDNGDGNQFRIAAAAELHRASCSFEDTVNYFRTQEDFDEEETRLRVGYVFEGNYHRTSQETLQRLCTRFVSCDNCGYDGICDYIGR